MNTKRSGKRFRMKTALAGGFVVVVVAGASAVGITTASAAPAGAPVSGQGPTFEEAHAAASAQCDSRVLGPFRTTTVGGDPAWSAPPYEVQGTCA